MAQMINQSIVVNLIPKNKKQKKHEFFHESILSFCI
jgi:hypothetical protein